MVFVMDTNRKPLSPCHPARARKLLSQGKAKVFRMEPFTIILNREVTDDVPSYTLKIDPGTQHTGISITRNTGDNEDAPEWMDVDFLVQIEHRGGTVKERLEKRAGYRRNRRSRKCPYREERFLNREKPEGWFPSSIRSILQNTVTIAKRLMTLCPIDHIEYELVCFDTQLMQNPEIYGVDYQQGPLYRTNMRAFLLSEFDGTCQYCGAKGSQMEWEHIIPRSRGGSNALSNATLSCPKCNQAKGNMTPAEWEADIKAKKSQTALDKKRLEGIKKVQTQTHTKGLADAGKSNAIRWRLKEDLEAGTGLSVTVCRAANTRVNRTGRGIAKDHCVDAACVGKNLPPKIRFRTHDCLIIEAKGRGSHCRTRVNASGFPVSSLPRQKKMFGYQTGDFVKAVILKGKNKGTWIGKINVRSSGNFRITVAGRKPFDVNWKYLTLLQHADGYSYTHKGVYPWNTAEL